MAERFTDHLRQAASAIWEAQHAHPFIRGIGDGTLELSKFKHWVRQDYVFLIDYARMLSLAASRAPELEAMTRLAELAHATLETEMSLHRTYAKEFGITARELEREAASPTCRAYTDFLVRTAATGSFPELVGALLPCMWGFSEVGLALKRAEGPADSRYVAWIDMYASREFTELATWCRDLLDRVVDGLPPRELQAVEGAFVTSSRYEYLFWEMAWREERWPV